LNNFFDFDVQNIEYVKTSNNFFVDEVPLYSFSENGNFLIALVQKQDLTTWEMIKIISEYTGVKIRDIGYCGLKDKYGTTTQHISLDKKYEQRLKNFSHHNIQIMNITHHDNKLKIGHLKGNKFSILLDGVSFFDILEKRIDIISQMGIANYFGYQRFGVDDKNFEIGRNIIEGKTQIREKHKSKFFISAYQSYLFNKWLDNRVEISKNPHSFDLDSKTVDSFNIQEHPFKIFDGEVYLHYPYGRIFQSNDTIEESKRFYKQDIAPTGLIAGEKVTKSTSIAYELEGKIDIISKTTSKLPTKQILGGRRFAWIFPKDMSICKHQDKIKIDFFLPKGSYATVLLEQLGLRIIK